ncbi:VOC family protein [Dactylosporangium sp. CS-033363]|uniref:VOC family protein n=1 Tax=Dactylosporangium sp. CS-033363 TaxID=3239935 RepID=UPI003D8DDA35
MSDAKTPPPNVWPTLRATDARALMTFLADAFGFVESAAYGEGDVIHHAEMLWPEGGGIMLGSDRQDGSIWALRPGTFGAYVVTADPDGIYERAKRAGAEILQELNETDYGSRGFSVRDPEGNLWSFGTYPGEPLPS